MNLLSPILSGDSLLSEYCSDIVLGMLRGVDVYWLTTRLGEQLNLGSINTCVSFRIPCIESGKYRQLDNCAILIVEPKNNLNNLDALIVHELVHIGQFRTGRLKLSNKEGCVIWEGEECILHHSGDPGYWEQPWEVEAYQTQAKWLSLDSDHLSADEIYSNFKEQYDNLLKHRPV